MWGRTRSEKPCHNFMLEMILFCILLGSQCETKLKGLEPD